MAEGVQNGNQATMLHDNEGEMSVMPIQAAFIRGDKALSKFLGGISRPTLTMMREMGLPFYRFSDNILLYDPKEVSMWICEHSQRNEQMGTDLECQVQDVPIEKVTIRPKFRK